MAAGLVSGEDGLAQVGTWEARVEQRIEFDPHIRRRNFPLPLPAASVLMVREGGVDGQWLSLCATRQSTDHAFGVVVDSDEPHAVMPLSDDQIRQRYGLAPGTRVVRASGPVGAPLRLDPDSFTVYEAASARGPRWR